MTKIAYQVVACALLLAWLGACVDGPGQPNITTETHWLQGCSTDADCQIERDYACLCGVCTAICDAATECFDQLHVDDRARYDIDVTGVACAAPDRLGSEDVCGPDTLAEPGVCLPTCVDAASECDGPVDDPYETELVCAVDAVCDVPSGGDNNNRVDEAAVLDVFDATTQWLQFHRLIQPTLPVEASQAGRLDPEEAGAAEHDRDYYRFELLDAQWTVIVTSANPSATFGLIDTVIALYDDDDRDTPLATNDNAIASPGEPPLHYDSELIVWLPAGSYFIEVADSSDWYDRSWTNEPGDYRLGVGRLGDDEAEVIVHPGSGEVTLEPGGGTGSILLLGLLAEDDTRHTYQLPGRPRSRMAAARMPPGRTGYGGPTLSIAVSEEGGDAILGRIAGDRGRLDVPVAPGDYTLVVARDGQDAARLPHYVIKLVPLQEDAVIEALSFEPADSVLGGGEALEAGQMFVVWLEEGDVDYVSFDVGVGVAPGGLECRSWLDGSGVVGLDLEARDDDDELLEQGFSESLEGGPAYLFGQLDSASGLYHVRLENTEQDPEVTGTWVRCNW